MKLASHLLLMLSPLCSFLAVAQQPDSLPDLQVVRVSYVEGDVRVARGKAAEKSGAAPWEQAVADLPIEPGFSLVTGEGRAEIEFEDSSVLYLAPNSVLEFLNLTSSSEVPRTEVALLSGMASLDYTPSVPGDQFFVRTPTDRIGTHYPQKSFMRVNAYLDATTLTSLRPMTFHLGRTSIDSSDPTPFTVSGGVRISPANPADPQQFSAWDQWVQTRVTQREAAQRAVMQEAHLRAPIPGLAEMNEQGRFFDCAPYGTCWEPKGAATDVQQASTTAPPLQLTPAETAAMARQTVSVKTLQQGGPNAVGNAAPNAPLVNNYDDFPCEPWWQRTLYRRDPMTGLLVNQYGNQISNPYPFRWAVCHTGAWININRHYVWVVGRHPHHREPCVWVKTPKGTGVVPIHPRDVAGKIPINLAHGVLSPTDKRGTGITQISWSNGEKAKLLESPPKGFRNEFYPLARSSEPHAVAFSLNRKLDGHPATAESVRAGVRPGPAMGTPIVFDRKTQSFNVAHDVRLNSGAVRSVSEPIGGRNVQVRASLGGLEGGHVGSYSGGSAAHGSSGGGSYGGGAASHSAPSATAAAPASASAGAATGSSSHK